MYYLRLKKYENRLTNTPDPLYVFPAHNNCVLTGVIQYHQASTTCWIPSHNLVCSSTGSTVGPESRVTY
jgi:hypothetical protein